MGFFVACKNTWYNIHMLDIVNPIDPSRVVVNKVEYAEKTYFFERSDGKIMMAKGREAWNLYKMRNQVLGTVKPNFKLVGTSDGQIYQRAVIASQEHFMNTRNLKEAQDILRKGETDEYAQAKGKIERPPNYDRVGSDGQPTNLIV